MNAPLSGMPTSVDTRAIAERIRCLVGASNFEGLDAIARRLGVPEFALRLSLDDEAPHPTLDVLSAIVREYGVDPTWLIRGEYNSATHHAVLDDEENITPMTLLTLAALDDQPAIELHALRKQLALGAHASGGVHLGDQRDATL